MRSDVILEIGRPVCSNYMILIDVCCCNEMSKLV
jgi:hypothetical protein